MRLSIKAKTLLLFISIPLVTLGSFLFASSRLFESDKKAYVFSASYSEGRGLADQVQSWVDSQLLVLKSLSYFYDFQSNQINPSGKQYFEVSKQVLFFGIYQWVDNQWVKKDALERKPGHETEAFKIAPLESLGKTEKPDILASASPGVFLIATVANQDNNKYLFVEGVASERIGHLFLDPGDTQRIFWVPGKQIMWAEDQEASHEIMQGAQEIDEMNEGSFEIPKKAMVSVVSLQPLPFFVVTSVRMAQAMKAKEALIHNSLFLAFALIGLILIVGVVSSNHLTRPLLQLKEAVSRVARGEFGIQTQVKSKDEIGELASGFNSMSEKLQSLVASEISKARMEKELETAQAVQEGLLPASNIQTENFVAAAYYSPASECGGDLWQYFETADAFHVVVGDVTGHGAAASLITSAIVGCVHSLKESDPSPDEALRKINDAIFSVARGRMQATLFWARIDKKTREMKFANSGHEALVLKNSDWLTGKQTWKELVQLQGEPSRRIGESPKATYVSELQALQPGDSFLLFTDGIYVRKKGNGEDLNESDWMRALSKIFKENPTFDKQAVALRAYCESLPKDKEKEDDLTWVYLQLV